MNIGNILVGVGAGVLYAFLGFAAQTEKFDWRKFLRTVAIVALSALGLDVAGVTADIYSAALSPTAITVFIQKLIDSAKK